jgi:hypothetical protein
MALRKRQTTRFLHSLDVKVVATAVASAGNLTLGRGCFFDVSGTTTINYLDTTGVRAGRLRIIRFAGSLTVKHNLGSPGAGFANIKLTAVGDFSATAGHVITVVYDGTNWQQTAGT